MLKIPEPAVGLARIALTDVLDLVEPEAGVLEWAILDLGEALAYSGSDFDVMPLQEAVAASPAGLRLSFHELREIACRFHQIVDGLFVASPGGMCPARTESDSALLDATTVLIAAVDSTFWLVSAPASALRRLAERFPDATSVTDPVLLSTWGRGA